MTTQSYLIFKLNQSRYGIPTTAVQEIFFLPEITPIADAPREVLGVINLRGEFLPVVDLGQRLGQPRNPFQLTDSLIVVEGQGQRIGMTASQVEGVQAIASEQTSTSLYGYTGETLQNRMIAGIATVEADIIMLLDPAQLLQSATLPVVHLNGHGPNGNHNGLSQDLPSGETSGLYDQFDDQARQILRERTIALQAPIVDQDSAGLMPLAVVSLAGEYFGFELGAVHEFTNIHKITPVPCCPPHVVGNINLRGEIITLININQVIDLPTNMTRSQPKAVVVRLDQRVAGIAVDDIFDVTYLHPSRVTLAPIAMHSARDEYLQGVAPYRDRMMSIINLSKLLASDVLVVNEEA